MCVELCVLIICVDFALKDQTANLYSRCLAFFVTLCWCTNTIVIQMSVILILWFLRINAMLAWYVPLLCVSVCVYVHRVSKELCQLTFCSMSVKYEPILIKI